MKMTITIPDDVHEKLVQLNKRTNIPLSKLISMGIEYLDGKNDRNEEQFADLLKEAESEVVLQKMTPLYQDYEIVHLPILLLITDKGLIGGMCEPYNPLRYNRHFMHLDLINEKIKRSTLRRLT